MTWLSSCTIAHNSISVASYFLGLLVVVQAMFQCLCGYLYWTQLVVWPKPHIQVPTSRAWCTCSHSVSYILLWSRGPNLYLVYRERLGFMENLKDCPWLRVISLQRLWNMSGQTIYEACITRSIENKQPFVNGSSCILFYILKTIGLFCPLHKKYDWESLKQLDEWHKLAPVVLVKRKPWINCSFTNVESSCNPKLYNLRLRLVSLMLKEEIGPKNNKGLTIKFFIFD